MCKCVFVEMIRVALLLLLTHLCNADNGYNIASIS